MELFLNIDPITDPIKFISTDCQPKPQLASFFKECKFYPYETNFSTPARMNSLEWLTSVHVTKSDKFLYLS